MVDTWDGEDQRFDIDELSEQELRQFPNLRYMSVLTGKPDELRKVCEPMGIELSW